MGAMIAGIVGTNLNNKHQESEYAFAVVSSLIIVGTITVGISMFLLTKKHFR